MPPPLTKSCGVVLLLLAVACTRPDLTAEIVVANTLLAEIDMELQLSLNAAATEELAGAETALMVANRQVLLLEGPCDLAALEAEALDKDDRLGPLGSTMVAETLAGLAIHDPSSYWHQNGRNGSRWQPADGVRPGSHVIESMPAMLRMTGVL